MIRRNLDLKSLQKALNNAKTGFSKLNSSYDRRHKKVSSYAKKNI